MNAFVKLGFAHRFSYKSGPFLPGGEKIYWPEMPSKSLPGGIVLLTDFSKNIPGGRDLRGINLRPHRSCVCSSTTVLFATTELSQHFSDPRHHSWSEIGSLFPEQGW